MNLLGAFVLTFLALYVSVQRGYGAACEGVVLALFGLGSAGGAVVGGVLADRLQRRPTILGAHLATAAVMAALAHGPRGAPPSQPVCCSSGSRATPCALRDRR